MIRMCCCVLPAVALMAQSAVACATLAGGTLSQSPDAPSQPSRSIMSAGATDPATQLQGNWTLTKIAGSDVPTDVNATMTVDAGRFAFSVGCNKIVAAAEFGPTSVQFENVLTTSMACEEALAELESALTRALSRVDAMQMAPGDNLTFFDEGLAVLIKAQRATP
ncbi:MAG: META domain-containing protein [Pseudomonadota bacterium]